MKNKEVETKTEIIDGHEWKITVVPPLTLGRARDRADIRPPGRVGNKSKQGAAKPVAAGRPQGKVE
jgi:hypothetical protein